MQFRRLMLKVNRRMRFLITVSPVPLTATATGHHVLAATTYSKSVLRAVAGELYSRFPDVDYFPSYELIATPFARGFFYESNLRAVSRAGVENVMRVFFEAHQPIRTMPEPAADASNDPVCEEELLDAFSR